MAAPGQQQGHLILAFKAFCKLIQHDLMGMENPMNAQSNMAGAALTVKEILPGLTENGGAGPGTLAEQRAANSGSGNRSTARRYISNTAPRGLVP